MHGHDSIEGTKKFSPVPQMGERHMQTHGPMRNWRMSYIVVTDNRCGLSDSNGRRDSPS